MAALPSSTTWLLNLALPAAHLASKNCPETFRHSQPAELQLQAPANAAEIDTRRNPFENFPMRTSEEEEDRRSTYQTPMIQVNIPG